MAERVEMNSVETYRFTLHSLDESVQFGEALGRGAAPGDVICLDGDLGAGKTTLAQQLARGLDVPADCYVTSPSFAIMHEYPGGRLVMYHMDFYRLFDSDDVVDNGFDEYFYQDGVTVIEWPERAAEILPRHRLHIHIALTDCGERELTCCCYGSTWSKRLQKILVNNEIKWQQVAVE